MSPPRWCCSWQHTASFRNIQGESHLMEDVALSTPQMSSGHPQTLTSPYIHPPSHSSTQETYIMVSTTAAAAAKSLQSCLTLCDPIDGSSPGSPVPGILQARTLEWVAISFSNAWKWKVKVKSLSRIQPSATPWTAAYQAPPPMGFSRQEYWSGVPLPSLISTTHSSNYLCTYFPNGLWFLHNKN